MSDASVAMCSIGSVADTNPETLPSTTPSDFRFRYIDLTSVNRGVIDWGAVIETTYSTAPSRARRVIRPLDTLFGTVRPNLQSHGFIDHGHTGPIVASTGFSVVRARSGVSHPGYLFHSLMSNSIAAQANRDAVGSSYPAVNDSDVKQFEIFMPPYREQERVAQILDTLDTAIQRTKAIVEKLKQLRKGVLHDLLTRGIDANGELRTSCIEAPEHYQGSELGFIPKAWKPVPLSSLLAEIGQGWSPDCASTPANFGSWGVLKTTAITWAGYNCDENKALPPKLKPRPELEVSCGDILITRAGPASRVGVVAYVGSTRRNLMISDKMYRMRVLESEVAGFIALALSSQSVQTQIGRALSGMAESQTNISQAIVSSLIVARPPFDEQTTIIERVEACTARIRREEERLIKLRATKSGLMDDLLTGRVRVTPLLAQ